MLELILALIFLGLDPIYGGAILVKECPGIANHASDLSVEFSDCDTGSSNCTLLSGNTYYLKTTFSPWVDGNDLRVRSMSQMGVLGVPQGPGRLLCPEVVTLDGEGCDPSTGLKPGRVYTHINTFHVRRMFPEAIFPVNLLQSYRRIGCCSNNSLLIMGRFAWRAIKDVFLFHSWSYFVENIQLHYETGLFYGCS